MKKAIAVIMTVVILLAAGALWYFWPDLDGYPDVRPYGIVPLEFRDMIHANLLNEVTLYDDILIRQELTEKGKTVTKYDYYGNILSVFELPFESVDARFSYEAGALIHVYHDAYLVILDDNNVVGRTENGNDLSILLYDSDGNFKWEYNLPGEDLYHTFLYQSIAVDGGYWIWLRESGVDPTYEVIRLDSDGHEVFKKELDLMSISAEHAYDMLGYLTCENGIISGYLTDYNGTDQFVTLDMELNLIGVTGRERPIPAVGIIDGEPVRYGLCDDGLVGEGILTDYPYGTPEMVLDYGDFYLVLSWKHTGVNHDYRGDPIIGSMPMRTQHIYAAYDKSNQLLWIGTVDSTRNS